MATPRNIPEKELIRIRVLLAAMLISGTIAFWREFLSRITIFFSLLDAAARFSARSIRASSQETR